MAQSPAASIRRSAASSAASLKRSNNSSNKSVVENEDSISVDTLVNHLLAAKRSLSSMTLVLRGHGLATQARSSHEDATILSAHSSFLRSSILDQAAILVRLRRGLQATYDWGKRDFRRLVTQMDEVDNALEKTMAMLRETVVESAIRPTNEDKRTLLDFVDEESVYGIRNGMKKSIEELQGIQQSFDEDLLRFDTDIRNLKKTLFDTPLPHPPDEDDQENISSNERLDILIDHSSNMADLLSSLTKHFDLCVTAIRITEGAAAVARRKAAEATQSQGLDGVSISGVIAEQESHVPDQEPQTAKDRAEMLRVVVQDAGEVDDVVQEIHDRLVTMEEDYELLHSEYEMTKKAYLASLEAHTTLIEIGDRLADYLAAEEDFRSRWKLEKEVVFDKLHEMKELRDFYDRYAGAYDSLILEVERRKAVDDRIRGLWKKAQDGVDKLLDTDAMAREAFRTDVGHFLPTDLWAGMQGPGTRYEVVPVIDAPAIEDVQSLRKSLVDVPQGQGTSARGEETPRVAER